MRYLVIVTASNWTNGDGASLALYDGDGTSVLDSEQFNYWRRAEATAAHTGTCRIFVDGRVASIGSSTFTIVAE